MFKQKKKDLVKNKLMIKTETTKKEMQREITQSRFNSNFDFKQ